ncbi:hypothetical protein PAXRUDRAFT_172359 [Paxillus rubicundulus Ve08.2h10]|uniref:Uncharacterized protein n=1 Tax=Paxillus rubicundulus Ve08.2h10 TaxID=930991 RepID=A0A0D0DDT0_9AGAM|nr:hypothetical protein PAXRUDRAFT_172359 [Paxillus rubicundulus Ve08.2h10]
MSTEGGKIGPRDRQGYVQASFQASFPRQADWHGRWKYSWTIIMDGNFKAKHMHDKKLDYQVFLMDGMGYMVGQKKNTMTT